jgi:hypothetical protein
MKTAGARKPDPFDGVLIPGVTSTRECLVPKKCSIPSSFVANDGTVISDAIIT